MITFIDCDDIEKHEGHDHRKKEVLQIQRDGIRYYFKTETSYRCRGVCDCDKRQEIHGPEAHQ